MWHPPCSHLRLSFLLVRIVSPGNTENMQADVKIASVEEAQTRSGHTRFVVKDDSGNEYTTFREQIGAAAKAAEGKRARIEYHESQRNGFTNVYLDKVQPAPEAPPTTEGAEPEEVGWQAATEAAPWLVGSDKPTEAVDPEELFERLKPFKDLVADDIRDGDDDDAA
jgi:hypothetical protein